MTGTTGYIELYNDDPDCAMPPLEADTSFHLTTAAAGTATGPTPPSPALSLPLPVPSNSSIVIQQTTHIERTVRTEVRASPSVPVSSSAPARSQTAVARLSSSPAAIPPPAATNVSRASSFSSSASPPSPVLSPPPPELVAPPVPVSSSHVPCAAAPSPVSSLSLSFESLSSESTSSTSAPRADVDPTDEFLEDEGLLPHFCPWSLVSSPMPSQSYFAYLDTCERTLPPDALAALQKCAPGDPTAENTHLDPFTTLRDAQHSTQQPATVMQRADSEHGLLQYKLVANRAIKEKEVIGFIAGHLETEHEAEREGVDRLHPSHIHINRGYLHRYHGYTHSDALVLSLKRFHNPLHHIRDPALFLSDSDEKRPEVSAYNVHVDLLLDPERRVPVIIAYAWVDIDEGQELTAYLGLGVWYSRDHQRLFLASRVNHWYHRKVADMEKRLDGANINFQKKGNKKSGKKANGKWSSSNALSSASKQKENGNDSKAVSAAQSDPPGPVLSAADEWRFLGDEEKREETIVKWHREQLGSNKGMEKVELWRVFALSQCAYVTKVFPGKSVSDDTKAALKQLPDFIPAHIAIGNDVLDVDATVIRRLVEAGHDETLCEVREVTSLISPVRYYSAPWHPAFCVVARKHIKKGTFVFTYSGELEQEIRNRDSVYVYDVPADNIRAHWPACPADLPDMVIDAEKYGGVARFVNDSRYRMHEGLAEGEAENLNHTFVFVDKCIHLCFYVTRDVKAREELVSTYGDEFWSVCTGQMLIQHRRYYNHIAHYHQRLAGLLHQHNLTLPEPPSYLLEAQPHFERKTALYPDEPHPTDTLATEEEWEVECILSKGRMSKEVHYLVKWVGFDDSYNSWVKKSEMACTQLIQHFEQQLKQDNRADRSSGKKRRKGCKGRKGKRGTAQTKDRSEAAENGGKEEKVTEARSSGASGSSESEDERRRNKVKKRKRKRAIGVTDDSSDEAEADSADGARTSNKTTNGRSKAHKPSAEQRAANKQKIREALAAARAKRSQEQVVAGLMSPAVLDESTDTEEDVGGVIEQGDEVSEAPLLPPIAPEDRMSLE